MKTKNMIGLVLVVVLFGCMSKPDVNPNVVDKPVVNPEPGVNPGPVVNPEETFSVIDANNKFAVEIYDKYAAEKDKNVFVSPFSISTALAMTYEGARGKTAEEMKAVLHLPEDRDKIRSGYAEVNAELNKADKTYKLSVANALWAQKDYTFVDSYLNTVETFYGGKATSVDFITKTEESRITINKWVEGKTNNKIKDLISKGLITPQTRLVLTNAIYFKANWSSQFEGENTRERPFKLSSGEEKKAKMMGQTNNFNYGETYDAQILEMNYLGDELSMLIILPKDSDQLESLSNKIGKLKAGMKSEKVIVSIPKFKFETKYEMSKALKETGMPTAFNYPDADFTGISPATLDSPNGELYISEVIHQTFIEVAEYGTEAAAATAVVMREGSAMTTEEPKTFTADHPFIFVIQQKESGNILFIGRVSDPTA